MDKPDQIVEPVSFMSMAKLLLCVYITKLSYHSEILKELHLFLRAVGREATKSKESCKLSRVVLRVEDKYGGLDVGVGILEKWEQN